MLIPASPSKMCGTSGGSCDRRASHPAFRPLRRERILDELRRTGAVRVAELARDFGVAELTIRRDITALADRGLLTRVHGERCCGARWTRPSPALPFPGRSSASGWWCRR